MKLALITALIVPAVVASASAAASDESKRFPWSKAMPKLFGADQLVDVEAHCEGCQPDYCYAPTEPDTYCYKNAYPKCCTKTKGNCPNSGPPGCECEGDCNGNIPPPQRGDRCRYGADQCGSGMFCEVEEGKCLLRIADIYGRCEPIPSVCQTNYAPVCGCDGKTYSNDCDAAGAGANVASQGQCGGETQCTYYYTDDDTCGGNYFCNIGTGNCRLRVAQQDGFCEEITTMCTSEYAPVCGCDGNDYANECEAFANGVNVEQTGRC